jgi:signal transduction histidine kinase
MLADGGGRHATLAVLHHRALQVTGGSCSLLFEPHPASGHLHVTSGAGIDALPIDPWQPGGGEAALLAKIFADRIAAPLARLAEDMPQLHLLLRAPAAFLLPLASDTRRFGLLAVGVADATAQAAGPLHESDVPAGFLLALELSRLRQREEFEHDVRDLLTSFADRLAGTLDLAHALEPLCVASTRLFAGDRTTVWLHDRESRRLVPLSSSDVSYLPTAVSVRTDDPIAPAAVAMRSQRAGLATMRSESTSVLTVPLRGCRRALGTLVFEGVRIEPGDDISLLNRADELGRQLSSAVETIQLLEIVTQSRRELEQLFASIAHLIVVVDQHGIIVRANDAFAGAVGETSDALRRRPLSSFVGDALTHWVGSLTEPLPEPAVTELVDDVLGGPYVVTATDLLTENGRHAGRVVVARDLVPIVSVREREELRSRLLQSEKLAALGHFVAGVAHELNNPLQGVLGHLELLRTTGAFPEKLSQEIRRIYRDADRAAKVVRTLMVFAGSGRLRRRKAGLNGIVQKVLALRKASCRARHIEVVRHYDQQLPRLLVDPLLLHQVFLNVVMNAEQAVTSTGEPGRIEITTGPGREDGWVVAIVRDTGPGLSDDTLPRVFEPFYTTRDVGQGIGLGLALAYGIIQEHGGRISADNHPDGGAVFTMELPIA